MALVRREAGAILTELNKLSRGNECTGVGTVAFSTVFFSYILTAQGCA